VRREDVEAGILRLQHAIADVAERKGAARWAALGTLLLALLGGSWLAGLVRGRRSRRERRR
jgi:hypothetical protein